MEQLKLENQICFPFYAISRLITRAYQPYLEKLGITYPQYLVLLVLWEKDGVAVQTVSDKLILNTNTVTPLLKRMEAMGLIKREKAKDDERKVLIYLTQEGKALQASAASVPEKLMENMGDMAFELEELVGVRDKIQKWIGCMGNK
ncbi:MarR family winged helix-turn-helix transcriptional regulator [Cecembia calidifontis]|uniref:DNA-binding MarR family transcriptional regulator n=1 Tax=Cecembia calidifontis TaxID=1187080 RepID=A0A4Q7P9N2_9BACT|nr:MarR family transcriptional regulator [Cecembia calidifontis]RZS96288.1 DNA-binding MarR family transcriptional regulator [Cecembia calidifontis]